MIKFRNLLLCIHLITILTTTAETTKTEKNISERKTNDPSGYKQKLGQGYETSESISAEELNKKIKELNELINESMDKITEYNESLQDLNSNKSESRGWEKKKFSSKPYKQVLKNDLKNLGARALGSLNLSYSKPKEKRRYTD